MTDAAMSGGSGGAVPATLGAILAGGLARRLGGGDKALRSVGGRTVLSRLIERVAPQVAQMILNANDDPHRFGGLGLPVVADSLQGHPGPLAGVLAALDWAAASAPGIDWVLTVPGDAPFLPRDLVLRLHAARLRDNARFACAASAGQAHPVVGLWPVAFREELRRGVTEQGFRRVDAFTRFYPCPLVEWPTEPVDPFFNVNTPADLAEADRLITIHPAL
jgi:molybdopterin-guanine dinucleotide biosynthesis protein A